MTGKFQFAGQVNKHLKEELLIRKNNDKALTHPKIVLLFLLLLLIWGFREILLRPIMSESLGVLGFQFVETLTKLAVWTIPALLLISYYNGSMSISLKDMLTNEVKWLRYLPVIFAIVAYNLIAACFVHRSIAITVPVPKASLFETVLFVGITEEFVFRGFFLNALLKKTLALWAVIISSVMFVIIHFPLWISESSFSNPLLFWQNCIGVFAISLVFGWTFVKSKNIFTPIIIHMIWNLSVILLLHR